VRGEGGKGGRRGDTVLAATDRDGGGDTAQKVFVWTEM
jgi:hypothetical protein